jgi:Holliday junction resolvasome RuvABC endonuclease subunit
VLALDPSGNFHEGKGTTGICVFNANKMEICVIACLKAADYKSMELYWNGVVNFVDIMLRRYRGELCLVIEDYFLYANKAASQINSRMETSKLIGVLQYYCFKYKLLYIMQTANEVKTRWTDAILHHKRYIQKDGKRWVLPGTSTQINDHCMDAIRHAVHFATFKNKGVDPDESS